MQKEQFKEKREELNKLLENNNIPRELWFSLSRLLMNLHLYLEESNKDFNTIEQLTIELMPYRFHEQNTFN